MLVNKTAYVYSLEETDAFIRSQMSEIELSTDESIYVPDVWIEDNPVCPIHNERIEEYPYVILHGNKTVKFNAYFCEKCNKTMLRRTKALDLEDMCAEVGIPMPTIEQLIPKIKKKKQTPKRDLKPHYFVENGKRKDFAFENSYDFYLLDESDTVVVSDSIYCNLLEHDTDEVMVVFSVNQKRDGRKNYLCLAGYCAQCQKYYMSEDDYKVIYPLGRPEVTIISDLEGGDYQITSGEVFDLEKKHLADLESDLDKKTDEIYNAADYALLHSEGESSLKNILQTGIDKGLKFYGMDKDNYYEMAHFTRLFHLDELQQTEERDMRSGGYVIETIEAAVWCLITTDSLKECLLKVVNMGHDTDTVAAVAGGLAGLYYGVDAIPKDWLGEITQEEYVEDLCEKARLLWK